MHTFRTNNVFPVNIPVASAIAIGVTIGVGVVVQPAVATVVTVTLTMMAWAIHHRPRVVSVVTVALVLPLFVDISHRALPVLYAFTGFPTSDGIPIHLGWVAILALLFRYDATRTKVPGTSAGLTLVALFTLALLTGAVRSGGFPLSIAFYGQTVLPILVFLLATRTRFEPSATARALLLSAGSLLWGVSLYALSAGSSATDRLSLLIPQYRNYFPAIAVVAGCVAMSWFRTHPRLAWMTLGGLLAFVPHMWSRTGMAMLVSGLAVTLLASGQGSRRMRRAGAVVLVVAIAAGATGIVGERASGDEFLGVQRRLDLADGAVERIIDNPGLGDAFVPTADELAGGRRANFTRIFPSHNQYLDYAVRSGLLAPILLVFLLAAVGMRAWRDRRNPHLHVAQWQAACLGIVAASAIGGLSQLYLTQTYPGSLIMLIIGLGAGISAVPSGTYPPHSLALFGNSTSQLGGS